MKATLALLFLSATATAAPAAGRVDLSRYLGEPKCRIAPLKPAPSNDIVDWSGDCEGGFASGKGRLLWHDAQWLPRTLTATLVRGEIQGTGELKTDKYTYTGPFLQGMPHGSGAIIYPDGSRYEGDVVDGKREGKGSLVGSDPIRYVGEWKGDQPHGWGDMHYWDGGSYEGQFEAGLRQGKGTLTYAGRRHKVEGQFEHDRIAGTMPPETETVRDRTASGNNEQEYGQSWETLTDHQKNIERARYPTLERGDDPPYPAQGLPAILQSVSPISWEAKAIDGGLRVRVLVGADGRAKQVETFERPILLYPERADKMVKDIANVMMLAAYKPALCRGEPCEMAYQLYFTFGNKPGAGTNLTPLTTRESLMNSRRPLDSSGRPLSMPPPRRPSR